MALLNISSIVWHRMTPACFSAASTISSLAASEPVCEAAAEAPCCVRPDFRTSTGLPVSWMTRRAASTNAAPSVISSRYIRMTFVAGSSLSASIRSMSLMSALLPKETNLEKPMFLACA